MMDMTLLFGVLAVCFCLGEAAPPERRVRDLSYSNTYMRHEAPLTRGCMYQNKRYEHGEVVQTEQPCLNCTCSRGVLLCFLRVCPLLTVPGQGCFTARKEGDCCPSVVCSSDRPSGQPSSSSTQEPLETTTLPFYEDEAFNEGDNPFSDETPTNSQEEEQDADIGMFKPKPTLILVTSTTPRPSLFDRLDEEQEDDFNYLNTIQGGCFLNGSLYAEGSAVLPKSFCEYCYCIRGKEMCVKPKCHLAIQGCNPNYSSPFSCCPTSYECGGKNESLNSTRSTTTTTTSTTTTTTPEPTTITPTTSAPTTAAGFVCEVGGQEYSEGEAVPSGGHCQNCFCSRDGVRCQDLECSPQMDGCIPITPEGHCCPVEYNCSNSTLTTTESSKSLTTSSQNLLPTVIDEIVPSTNSPELTTQVTKVILDEVEPQLVNLENLTNSEHVAQGHYQFEESSVVKAHSEPDSHSHEENATESAIPKLPSKEELTTPELPIKEELTTPDLPIKEEVTTPELPIKEELTTPKLPMKGELSPKLPINEELTTPKIPIKEELRIENREDDFGIDIPETEENLNQEESIFGSVPEITSFYDTLIEDVSNKSVSIEEIDPEYEATRNPQVQVFHSTTEAVPEKTTSFIFKEQPQKHSGDKTVSLVIMSDKTNHSYVLSVATPSDENEDIMTSNITNSPVIPLENVQYIVQPDDNLHKSTIGESLPRVIEETTPSSYEPNKPDKNENSTTSGEAYKSNDVNQMEFSTKLPEGLTTVAQEINDLNKYSGPIDKDGLAAIRENHRIIYFSDPDIDENFKKLLESEANSQQLPVYTASTEPNIPDKKEIPSIIHSTEENKHPIYISSEHDRLDKDNQEKISPEEDKDTNHPQENINSEKYAEKNTPEKPMMSSSPDGSILNVYYAGTTNKSAEKATSAQEHAVNKTESVKSEALVPHNLNQELIPGNKELQNISKSDARVSEVIIDTKKLESDTSSHKVEVKPDDITEPEPEVTVDPWALYYRAPVSSYHQYYVPGERDPSPYLYIPGEGTYYRPQGRDHSATNDRSPVFSRPDSDDSISIGGPRNNDEQLPRVEIITAPTPQGTDGSADFGRHHLYKQDSKQSRADADMKIVSLKQIFQVSSSNSGNSAPKSSVVSVLFSPNEGSQHYSDRSEQGTFSEPKPENFIPLQHHPTVTIDRRQDVEASPEKPKEPKPFRVIPFLAEDAVGSGSKSNHSIFVGPFRFNAKSTTAKPDDLQSGSCLSGGKFYNNGDMIYKSDPCQLCRCFYGKELCQKQTCPEMPHKDCIAENLPGYCCPRITCVTTDPELENNKTSNASNLLPKIKDTTLGLPSYDGAWKVPDSATPRTPIEAKEEVAEVAEPKETFQTTSPLDSVVETTELPGIAVIPMENSSTSSTVEVSSTLQTSGDWSPIRVTIPPLKEPDNRLWGLLKVSGCNIYGKFYKLDELVTELSGPCNSCVCSVKGVDCSSLC